MTLESLFEAGGTLCKVSASTPKQLLQDMATSLLASKRVQEEAKELGVELDVRDIVNAAMERERLGSTGVGSGVALPHARLFGIKEVHAVFASLETPIDYQAIDDRPVDLVALIIAPEESGGAHLRALARISRRLRREDVRARLRSAPNPQSLYVSLVDEKAQDAA